MLIKDRYTLWVGKRVRKTSGKPFKSKQSINTVKSVGVHPEIFEKFKEIMPCFYFADDDSHVLCSICELVEE